MFHRIGESVFNFFHLLKGGAKPSYFHLGKNKNLLYLKIYKCQLGSYLM
jgi:hypothetical protein